MGIITVGIDLAKNVFAVHGVDETGRAVLVKPKVRREELPGLIANLPARPHRSAHRPQVRHPLPHERETRQERRRGRRRHR
jgi:hypothetical protein